MISMISGKIIKKTANSVVVDTGGIGYLVFVPIRTVTEQTGKEVELWTHMTVRENAMELYGFKKESELKLFQMLISVTGVGSKSALAILSIEDAETIKRATARGDHSYLTKVSGVGKKSAQRIIIELKDKFDIKEKEESDKFHKEDADVLDALVTLGYKKEEAKKLLREIPEEVKGAEARLKHAIKKINA